MKQITLTTAVLAAVKNFRDDVFSIFNITRSIREDIENGDYDIIKGNPIGANGKTQVLHADVKDIFIELLDNVYGNDYSVRDSGRGYREFQRTVAVGQTQTQVQPAKCPAPGCTNPNTTSCAAPQCPQASPLDCVKDTITSYLRSNGPRTMKQIQSRLKGFTTTCEDLATYLENLGIVDNSTVGNAPSKVRSKQI